MQVFVAGGVLNINTQWHFNSFRLVKNPGFFVKTKGSFTTRRLGWLNIQSVRRKQFIADRLTIPAYRGMM